MFTETELRKALEHSAARADAADTAVGDAVHTHAADAIDVEPGDRPRRPTSRRRWARLATPLVAAAAVAGVAVGVVAAVSSNGGSGDEQNAAGPTDAGTLLDLMHIGSPPDTFRMALHESHGYHWVSAEQQASADGAPELALIPAGEPFSDDAIPRDHPVRIDGHTGYYGYIPLNPGADTDENTPSKWGVAFRNDQNDWVVASVENSSPTTGDYANPRKRTKQDPAAIVAAFEKLHVTFGAVGNRVAYKVGWLPDNTEVAWLGQSGGFIPDTTVSSEKAGYTSIEIGDKDQASVSISIDRPGGLDADAVQCTGYAKSAGASVCVRGYDAAKAGYEQDVAERVLDHLTVAPTSDDPKDFFTVGEAFGTI